MKSLISNESPKIVESSHYLQNTEEGKIRFVAHVMVFGFFTSLGASAEESHKSTLALVSMDIRNESSRLSDNCWRYYELPYIADKIIRSQ